MAAKSSRNKRSEQIREIVRQEGDNLFDELGDSSDPEFDPTKDLPRSGPEFFSQNAKHRDELVIDELLASVPRNQGYYLKLYRNVGPNQYELKQRIDNYDAWTDLEWEITSIVRHNTKLNPSKWGSGTYRIVIWRDSGIRNGSKYRPTEFYIDAQEPEGMGTKQEEPKINPMEYMQEQMSGMAQMMQAVSAFMPKQADPNILHQHQAEAFKQGLAASANENTSNNNAMAMMMGTMMTMVTKMMETMNQNQSRTIVPTETSDQALARMVDVLTKLGLTRQPEKTKGLIEQLTEMKALGIDPFKQNDPMAQIQQVKSIVSLVGDITGGGSGERPSIIEKIIDALAPALPSLLPSIKGLSDNYLMLQQPRAFPQTIQPIPQMPKAPQRPVYEDSPMGSISGGMAPAKEEPPTMQAQMQELIERLRHSIINQDQAFFPHLFTLVVQYGGDTAVNGIVKGYVSAETLTKQVQMIGGESFKNSDMEMRTKAYAKAFIAWVQGYVEQQNQRAQQQASAEVHVNGNGKINGVQMAPNAPTNEELDGVLARCVQCQAEYVYDNEDQFNADQGTCEDIMSGTTCGGVLTLVK